MAERLVRDLAIEEALQIKIKATLSHNNQSHFKWFALSDEKINKNKVKLTITYYMGWQKISSGRIYDSCSGRAFIIGGIYYRIIGMVPYSKACQKCDAEDNGVEEAD